MHNYIGQQLGNYRLLHLLGEGGFAQVYLAEHIYLKTQAAVKVLRTNLPDSDLQIFLHEARTVARLRHPLIVRVLEFGVTPDQVPFLAMTYAPNGTLRQRHPKQTTVPLKNIVLYVHQVATALQIAHDQRLIHRDVKPENMLLGRNDEVLLSDFGIAVAARNTLSEEKEGISGTVTYMAPEQLRGRPRPASDQYSLGVIVYEWLTGNPPFSAPHFMAMAVQHLGTPPPPLASQGGDFSPEIEAVIMRTLAKDPGQRFPDVLTFARTLENVCEPYLSSPFIPTSSALTSSSLSTITMTTLDLVAETTISPLEPTTLVQQPLCQITTVPPESRTRQRKVRLQRRSVTLGLTGALGLSIIGGGIFWSRQTGTPTRPHSDPQVAPSPTTQPLPTQLQGTTLAIYSQHTQAVTGVTWAPSGNWIASCSEDKTVQIWSALESTPATTFVYPNHTDKVVAVAWSPHGKYLASASEDTTVRIWQAPHMASGAAGTTLVTYQEVNLDVPAALAWSPDSQRIASTTQQGMQVGVQVWDAESGKYTIYYPDITQYSPPVASGPANAVAWSPNGQEIVSSVLTTAVWSVASANRRLTYGSNYLVRVHGLAWSPDSQRVASASEDRLVYVWDATSGQTIFTCTGHTDAVHAVAWSPDGKYLVSASRDHTVQIWEATTGKHLFTYQKHTAPVNAVAWAKDSRHVVSGGDDKKVLVWQGI